MLGKLIPAGLYGGRVVAKKIETYIKLQVPAGEAKPSPPVGPALGQHGVNIMEFCKTFNADTQEMETGLPVPVIITVYTDKSFSYVRKTTPASVLLKKAAAVEKGSAEPNRNKVGKVSRNQLEEIAKVKMPDLNTEKLQSAMNTVMGTAKNMGIVVED